jgi:hypothetical protein
LVLALLICLGSGTIAPAGGLVTDCTETGLRQALAGGGVVTFASDCSITLTSPLELFSNDTLIDGRGRKVSISGGGTVPIFIVREGAALTNFGLTLLAGVNTNGGALFIDFGASVTLSNCTLAGNKAIGASGTAGTVGADDPHGNGGNGTSGTSGQPGFGGAVYNLGSLTILDCTFVTNSASGGAGGAGGNGGAGGDNLARGGHGGAGGNGAPAYGGAIFNSNRLVILYSSIASNSVTGGDGGLGGVGGTNLAGRLPGLTASGGAAGLAVGGGICNFGRMTDLGCLFQANTAKGGNSAAGGNQENGRGAAGPSGGEAVGGAIANAGSGGVTNSTFYNNRAVGGNGGNGGDGSGSLPEGGNGGNGGNATGGAVGSLSGSLALAYCTVANSSAIGGTNGVAGIGSWPGKDGNIGDARGGGLALNSGSLLLAQSLLSTNAPGTNAYGAILDAGYNLSSDATPVFTTGTSLSRTNPLLDTLVNNGGPTLTMKLLVGSPAMDKVPADSVTLDQRGVPRPLNGLSDIGAVEYEFNGKPAFVQEPANLTVAAGTNATFTTIAVGQRPLGFQWFFQTETNSPSVALTNNGNNLNYTITGVAATNEGLYLIVVTNAAGKATSSPARLTVLSRPLITSQPTNPVVNWSNAAIFNVVAAGTPPFAYQWYFNVTNPVAGATAASLTVANTVVSNAGPYQVVITNIYGAVTSTPATARIPATILAQPGPSQLTAGAGTNLEFSVGATGSAPLSYQWRFKGSNLSGANSSRYVLSGVTSANSGVYDVVVANDYGAVTSSPVNLTVVSLPVIIQQPLSQVVPKGSPATFVVGATNGPLTYQWRRDSTSINGATSSAYTIPSVKDSDAGVYTVMVTGGGTVVSAPATLTVLTPPSIIEQPQSLTVDVGTDATFRVTATGNPAPSYLWRFNGSIIPNATNSFFTRVKVQLSHAGQYVVSVSNGAGTEDSFPATLTVIVPDRPTISQPEMVSNQFSFTFQAQSDKRYEVQYKESLTSTNWVASTTYTNRVGTVAYTNTVPEGTPSRFYRLSVQ